MKEEEEILKNNCRRLISVVRSKQQHPESSVQRRRHTHKGAGGRERSGGEGEAAEEKPETERTSPSLTCQGPEVQPVPPQLIAMLRLKTFKEEMRRAAEVELHDPAVCTVCEQDQASLALTSFIRRKKTQLQYQTLKGRLNTRYSFGLSDCKDRRHFYPLSANACDCTDSVQH